MMPQDEFLTMITKFQSDIEIQAIQQTSFNRNENRRIKQQLGKQWRPHCLRGAYAHYLFKFDNPNNQNLNGFIRKVLCHQSDNSSLNYVAFQLAEDVTENIFQIPQSVSEIETSRTPSNLNELENSPSNLNDLTVKQLRKLAKEKGLKRYSHAKKSELLEMLRELE